MKAVAPSRGPAWPAWALPALLMLLATVPALAGAARLAELLRGAVITPANARFFAMPLPMMLHLLAVIPYTLLGALQFSAGLRRRWPARHRALGRVLLVCAMVSALTGLWMTLAYPWAPGDGVALYALRLLFGTAMTLAIVLGIEAIRRRDFPAHGRWMLRAYAIGMGAGTQVLTHLPYFVLVGKPSVALRAVLMGAGWVINVVVAEWMIRRERPDASPRIPAARSSECNTTLLAACPATGAPAPPASASMPPCHSSSG